MSDVIREAFEIVDRELRQNIPSGGSQVVRAWGRIKSALQQTAPAVPEGWRTAKDGGHWPHIGGKYLIKLNGVLQHEIYEFDQADDGCGGGEYFWDRDDLDEAAPFDPENDAWIPIDQAGVTTSAVPEAVHDLICGIRSINRANHHLVTVHGDDEPCYYQRAEWIQWILELADKAEAAAPQPDHSPDAGKVEESGQLIHVGYTNPAQIKYAKDESGSFYPDTDHQCHIPIYMLKRHLNRMGHDYVHPTPAADAGKVVQGEPVAWAVFADNGNLRIWGREKPKTFPNAVPLYLRPTVKESLTAESLAQLDSEDQKGMERIVEAVAHIGIDFGYGTYELEQCHIDRAREIKGSLDHLRASQQEGGEV